LWTRLTNDTVTADSVRINWRIATDTDMNNVINSGFGYTSEDIDWTFKVDETGLLPNTYYYYDFESFGKYSLTGRTKTSAVGDNDSFRFGFVSCSNWNQGCFSL
jgi:alkaline phosphatase D